jgi:hypothetical protein
MNRKQENDAFNGIIAKLPESLTDKNCYDLFLTAACEIQDGITVNKDGTSIPRFWNPPREFNIGYVTSAYKKLWVEKNIEKSHQNYKQFKEKLDSLNVEWSPQTKKLFQKALFRIMRGTDSDYISENVQKIIAHINYIKGWITEPSALFAYSYQQGSGKSTFIETYAAAMEKLGASIKNTEMRAFCSKDGWTNADPATYDVICCPNELMDDFVDWNQEENYVKHGSYEIRQKFQVPVQTTAKCSLAIATNSRRGQGNRVNTYIKFSDRINWALTGTKLDIDKQVQAWLDVITYCPRFTGSLKSLNTAPFEATNKEKSELIKFLVEHSGYQAKLNTFYQQQRRANNIQHNSCSNWMKELELLKKDGLIDYAEGTKFTEIKVTVNTVTDETNFWTGDRQPRTPPYLYRNILTTLDSVYKFTNIQNNKESNHNSVSKEVSPKNVNLSTRGMCSVDIDKGPESLLKDDLTTYWKDLESNKVDSFRGTGILETLEGKYIVSLGGCYETINPLKEGSTTASGANVASMANFLFECDEPDTLKEQHQLAHKLAGQNIINRVIFSGGKSLHCRVTIKDEPKTREEYKFAWHEINKTYFNELMDKACANPERIGRKANVIRDGTYGKGCIVQTQYYLKDTILDFDWRTKYTEQKQAEEFLESVKKEYHKEKTHNSKIPSESELLSRKISPSVKKLLENSFSDGERHEQLPKAIGFLKLCGWDEQTVADYVKGTGIKDWESLTHNLFKK